MTVASHLENGNNDPIRTYMKDAKYYEQNPFYYEKKTIVCTKFTDRKGKTITKEIRETELNNMMIINEFQNIIEGPHPAVFINECDLGYYYILGTKQKPCEFHNNSEECDRKNSSITMQKVCNEDSCDRKRIQNMGFEIDDLFFHIAAGNVTVFDTYIKLWTSVVTEIEYFPGYDVAKENDPINNHKNCPIPNNDENFCCPSILDTCEGKAFIANLKKILDHHKAQTAFTYNSLRTILDQVVTAFP